MALASVIIPVWNGAAELPACLDALLAQTGVELEVLAVDNASTDGSGDLVAARYPQVRLLRQPANLGFGGGCNAGLAAAHGDVLVLLNQDTEVRPGWLAALVDALQNDPAAGIAGSKALYPDGTLQHAGGVIDRQGSGSHRGAGQPDTGQYDQVQDVEYVTGASLALSRRAYTQVGGFDEGFGPAYFEDVDLCFRVRHAGLRVVYVPASVLVHKEQSRAVADPGHDAMLLYHRNRLRFVAKHWPLSRLQTEFLPAEQGWLEQLGPGSERLIAALHEAYLIQLLSLGNLAAWRQRLLDEPPQAVDALAGVFLLLRMAYPLEVCAMEGPTAARPELQLPALAGLQPLAELQEHRFRSQLPLVGRWIAAFRRQWNRVSTEWYVKPLLRQQSDFNHQVVLAFSQMRDRSAVEAQMDEALLASIPVLREYIRGQAREISRLSQAVESLQRRLDEQS
jgi:GT2 family glycosyltransferase